MRRRRARPSCVPRRTPRVSGRRSWQGDRVTRAQEVATRLRAAGCVFAEDEAALLLGHARETGADERELDALVARRCAGEPLELVVGWAAFAGLRVTVAPGVFVPRRRTELLVAVVDGLLQARGVQGGPPVVVDLCCGTGALAAAVQARWPHADVHAADVDPAAVACARRNVRTVHEGDLFAALPEALRGSVDVLVANAPYVPSHAVATMPSEARDHEALVALDGGADGLDLHRRIAADVGAWLVPGGHVVVETSPRQAATSARLLRDRGLVVRTVRDDERDGTAVVGRRVSHVARTLGRSAATRR